MIYNMIWYCISVPLEDGTRYFEVCRCDTLRALSEVLHVMTPAALESHSHIRITKVEDWVPERAPVPPKLG